MAEAGKKAVASQQEVSFGNSSVAHRGPGSTGGVEEDGWAPSIHCHPHSPSVQSSVTWAGTRALVGMDLACAQVGGHLAC